MRMLSPLLLVCLLAAAAAQAGKVYRWVDAKGQAHYGDLPDGDAREVRELSRQVGAETEPAPVPDPAVESARRAAECAAKRQQLDTYEKSVRLIEKDNLGREREFSPQDKATLIERTQVEVVQLCDDGDKPPG